jgi:hypothetical protein
MSDLKLLPLTQAASLGAWADMCGPADLFCTPGWLSVELDGSGPWVPADRGCLVATDEGQVVAGVTLQQFDLTVDDVTVRVDKMMHDNHALAASNDGELADALMPSLMCGGWFNSRVLTTSSLSGDGGRAARQAIVDEAVATGRRWGSACVFFPYVSAGEAVLCSVLEATGFARFPTLARHVFDCDYPSYAGYLDSLPSRRRTRIRGELRKLAEAGVVTSHQPLDDSIVERTAELACQLEVKHQQKTTCEQLTPWFAAIARHVPTTIFTARHSGCIFAMSMWLHHQGRMYGFHAGFEYEVGGGLPMYSVMGYRLPIAYGCSDPGTTLLEYGISTDEAKLLRGTRAMPQFLYVKPLSGRAACILAALSEIA